MKKDELKKEDNLIIEEQSENNGEVVQAKDQEAPEEVMILKETLLLSTPGKEDNIAVITNNKYRHAFSTYPNNYAYLTWFTEKFINNFEIEKNGQLKFLMIDETERKKNIIEKSLEEKNFSLLRSFYTAMVKSIKIGNNEGYIIRVDAKKFFYFLGEDINRREIGRQEGKEGTAININNKTKEDVFNAIREYENCIGVLGGNSWYKTVSLQGYSEEDNELIFSCPYLYELWKKVEKESIKEIGVDNQKKEIRSPSHSYLIHGDIGKERNKTAIEIVNYIIPGLEARGSRPDYATYKSNQYRTFSDDRIVTYSVSYLTIIKSIPEFERRLNSYSTTRDKNRYLKSAFTKAFELLFTKTDLQNVYEGIDILNHNPPTIKTLNESLEITHYGKIGN